MNNIRQRRFLKGFLALAFFGAFFSRAEAQTTAPDSPPLKTGKAPIIIVPGLTGSELVNKQTGDVVWFQKSRAKDDDIRLPISPVLSRNRDNLVAGDIIRNVQFLKILPEIEIYDKLIDSLEKRGAYKEGKWGAPPKDGHQDTFYVFAYDWRLDNVENARLLGRKIKALKRKLRKPSLKFNVVAHSMGGLITRYAAMYGDADLPPRGRVRPTWAGARDFDRIFLLGTPNEGSVESLKAILEGFSYIGGGLNLPFIQNVSKFDMFSIPSMYQLLPHNGTFRIYDENLQPLKVDLFDPKVWNEFGWNAIADDGFAKNFSAAEVRGAKAYFANVLSRAKRFQDALDANSNAKIPVAFYLLGGDCKETPDSVIVYRDKKNKWKTQFNGGSFDRANGEKVSSDEVKKIVYSLGDGVVSKRSLTGETFSQNGKKALLPVTSEIFLCEGHTKLITSTDAQDKLFALLFGYAVEQTTAENDK